VIFVYSPNFIELKINLCRLQVAYNKLQITNDRKSLQFDNFIR